MKVYRISPEIAYGFINNKSRSISLLGDNSEFEELNKMYNNITNLYIYIYIYIWKSKF